MTAQSRPASGASHAETVSVVTGNKVTLRFPNLRAAVRNACDLYNSGAISYAEMDDRIRQARRGGSS